MARPERRTRLTAAAAALLTASLSVLAPENPRLWDVLNRNLAAAPDPRVVIVGIDDLSLQDYGRLETWDRSLYARALGTLRQAGARAVGIDVLFDSPARGDDALGAAVAQTGVVLASSPELPQGGRPWKTTYGVSTLNIEGGGVSRFQTAYQDVGAQRWPSLSAQLARLAGVPRPLNTERQILRYVGASASSLPMYSFRDVVGGNVRFSDFQNKVVLIGLTASGVPGNTFPDSRLNLVPGVTLQARAVSSLLSEPFRNTSPWLTALICGALAAGAVLLGGLWGFGLAAFGLGVSAPLYLAGLLFPGVTASLAAIVGTVFVALERALSLRRLGSLDPLTGLGNRLAFTRAVEPRWNGRAGRPLGLLLVDLGDFRRVNEVYGRQAGDELLREVAARLRSGRTRRDLVFRWGADEFAVLVEPISSDDLARLAAELQGLLSDLKYRDVTLRATVGQAVSTLQMLTPGELVEQASRERYRNKYKLEQLSGVEK